MKQVLIVDDAPFVRLTLKNMLEKNGFLIAGEATNGQEAIMNYFQLKPDVVTMDISMPVMNGITALKQIINKDPQANVIMVTAV
nr:response regulator [Negativicutes bacterium]